MLSSIRQCCYIFVLLTLTSCSQKVHVSKLEMDLSSFGVESDSYPTIHAFIDLSADSSSCKKFYYSPGHNDSAYSLDKTDIEKIKNLIEHADLKKLKESYRVSESDQPTSTVKFYMPGKIIVVKDYGLKGDYPLQDLYKIVYKF